MSPELFVKDGVHSYQSDLWSLGCVFMTSVGPRALRGGGGLARFNKEDLEHGAGLRRVYFFGYRTDPEPTATIQKFSRRSTKISGQGALATPDLGRRQDGLF